MITGYRGKAPAEPMSESELMTAPLTLAGLDTGKAYVFVTVDYAKMLLATIIKLKAERDIAWGQIKGLAEEIENNG